MKKTSAKSAFLALSQYVLTQLYIGLYLLVQPTAHWVETFFIPTNILILTFIIGLTTYYFVKKYRISIKEIWYGLPVLFFLFFIFQIGWFYYFVFSVRQGFIWKDFDIISIIDAFLTALEYTIVSGITYKIIRYK